MDNLGLLLLNTLLQHRQQNNTLYSLSAMARDLGISQPQLSRILQKKRRLSPSSALKLGKLLKLDQKQLLELLVSTIENEAIEEEEK